MDVARRPPRSDSQFPARSGSSFLSSELATQCPVATQLELLKEHG